MMHSDDDGMYAFEGLEPSQYVVDATDPQFQTAAFGQRSSLDRGDVVQLNAGAAADHIDISMPRMARITGRIVDEYGDSGRS